VLLILALIIALASAANYVTDRETHANTTVYFPTCLQACTGDDGECSGTLAASDRFPAVIFLQGGSVDASHYEVISAKLASAGYIVAVPNAPVQFIFGTTVQLTSPNLALAAKNLLISLDTTASSGIFGRLTQSFALSGHSFGGVMAVIAASHDAPFLCGAGGPLAMLCFGYPGFGPGLKAVVAYGTSMVNRQQGPVVLTNTNTTGVPVVLVRGKLDGKLIIEDVHRTYDEALETPKAFIELDLANHYGITDTNGCTGCSAETIAQTKSQDWSTGKIKKIFVTALDAHVKNNANALNKIYVTGDIGPAVVTVAAAQL